MNWKGRGRIDPAWWFPVGAFVVARTWFLIWPFVVSAVVPMAVQNLDLFGTPVVAAFDLASSVRYVYSRQVDGAILSFRAGEAGYVTDQQTGSVWLLRDGHAQTGPYSGRVLESSPYTVEDLYPYHGVAASPNPLLAIWQRFDANWYLAVAGRGYSSVDGSTVYFPFFPFLIRVAGNLLLGRDLIGALVISNIALVAALYCLYRMSVDLIAESGARRALIYFVIFPTSFFLFAPYTESLFLCLSLGALYAGERRRWLAAGLLGALAALTRLQGFILIFPLAYIWWKQATGYGLQVAPPGHAVEVRRRLHLSDFGNHLLRGSALLLVPLASASFLAATNMSLLTTYEGQLHAQFVMPWDNVFASLVLIVNGGGSAVDVLNLTATLIFAVLSVVVWVKLPRAYGIYAVGMLLAPMFRMTAQQPLVSMTRYVLASFPAFIILGAWGENHWVNRAVVYLSLPLSLYLSGQFFLWGWVG